MDDTSYEVLKIHVLSTILKRSDGTEVTISNSILQNKPIQNIRRSGDMSESIIIDVPFDTASSTIAEFRGRILEWVRSQSKDFTSKCDLFVNELQLRESVTGYIRVTIVVQHKGNFMDGGQRSARKMRLILLVKELLAEYKIYVSP